MRFLILLVGIAIIYLLLKKYFRNLQQTNKSARPPATAENMVRCAQCGVNVPQTEAFFSRGEHFCSDEHRKLHQQ